MSIKTGHLFAGAGGGLLADLILGHKPKLAIEIEKSCCESLRQRQQEGWFDNDLYIHYGDVRDFDFKPWVGKLDCITAGFPCQDISVAGTGTGIEGSRSGLVSEVFRAIDDIRPGIVWLENSPNIRTRGRDVVIGELVARGYSWKDGILGAADVGAPHKRDRWWCIAANAGGMRKLEQKGSIREQWRWDCDQLEIIANINSEHGDMGGFYAGSISQLETPGLSGSKKDAVDNMRQRLQVAIQCGGICQADADAIQAAAGYTGAYHWSPPDSGICRMVDGMAYPMDGKSKGVRIREAGNGQVPLAAVAAWIILSGEKI